jgi:hypothetical protein
MHRNTLTSGSARLCATLFTAVSLAAVATPALADGGTVQGVLDIGPRKLELKFARATLHDNAEGLLQSGSKELRILLTDVDASPGAINGIAFLPVTGEARDGKVRGVLIVMKPDDPNQAWVTLLAPPADPTLSLVTLTLSSKPEPVIADYKMSGKSVSGVIKFRSDGFASAGLRFSAPVTQEPAITADLKGKAAVDSPQVKSMRARAQAMTKGDSATVAKLSTDSENHQLEAAVAQLGAQAQGMMREAGRNILPTLTTVERVVVRGDHAVVIFKNKESWQDMALVEGQWKTGK